MLASNPDQGKEPLKAILGIDIGGTGIKGALVDPETGALLTERFRILTPEPAKPKPVAEVLAEIARHFSWHGKIGSGFPAVVRYGKAWSAANIDDSWIGTDLDALFGATTGCPVRVINDADAAGLAEMRFGAGRGHLKGVVMMLTFGTGIGSAIFVDGHLLPNTELGHLQIRGKDAEKRASDAARIRRHFDWKDWSKRVNEYLETLQNLFWPDLFIIGGGASKAYDKFGPFLHADAEIVPAQMRNNAGIVGAALAAEEDIQVVTAPQQG